MIRLYVAMMILVGAELGGNLASAAEISLRTVCSGTFSCNDDGEIEPPPPPNPDDNGGNGDECDALCEHNKKVEQDIVAIIAQINQTAPNDVNQIADLTKRLSDLNTQVIGRIDEQRAMGLRNEQEASILGGQCEATDCPVEIATGNKITKAIDWPHDLLPITRVHRISHGSAWSLGAGWHLSVDSRIIFGQGSDVSDLVDLAQSNVDELSQALNRTIALIDDYQTRFVDRLGYSDPSVQAQIASVVAPLEVDKAQLESRLVTAEQKLADLQSIQSQNRNLATKNQWVTDPANPSEVGFGLGKVKWVAPNGNRYVFEKVGEHYQAIAGHSNRIELSDSGYSIYTAKGEHYLYSEKGLLREVSEPYGASISIHRNAKGVPTQLVDHHGRSIRFNFNNGKLAELVDAEDRKVSYQYIGSKLVEVTGFNGTQESYTYHYSQHPLALTSKSDGQDHTTHYKYAQLEGKTVVSKQIDKNGNHFSYHYSPASNTTNLTHRNGTQTTYIYNSNRQVVSKKHSFDGSEKETLFDDMGNVRVEYNGEGDITTYAYNEQGQRTSAIDGAGITSQWLFNADGRLESFINGNGESTDYLYDVNGKLDTLTWPDGSTIKEVWKSGLLQTRTTSEGEVTEYEYDDYGYPALIRRYGANTDYDKHWIRQTEFDAIGRPLVVSEGGESLERGQWRTTTYSYTADDGRSLNKPTRITDPSGRTATFVYDMKVQLEKQVDFSGVTTHYTYTPMGKVATKRIEMPTDAGLVEYLYSYDYDAEQNLVKAVHPGNVVWHYQYDGKNRLKRSYIEGTNVEKILDYDLADRITSESDAAGNLTSHQLLGNGKPVITNDPLGNTLTYEYDPAGRLLSINDAGRSAYRLDVEYNTLGQIQTRRDAEGNATHFSYTMDGEITSESLPNQFGVERHQVARDWQGAELIRSDAEGGRWTQTNNVYGQPIQIEDSEGGIEAFDYDLLGRKSYHLSTSGVKTTWDYDQQATQLVVTQIELDTTQIMGVKNARRESVKTYDLMGRLTHFKDAQGQQWRFAYNAQGLLSHTYNPDGSRIEQGYNAAGQQIASLFYPVNSEEGAVRASYYTYDGEGRVLTEQLPHYSLLMVNTYTYNGLGQVTSKTLPDYSTVSYHYDLAGRLERIDYPNGTQELWRYDANDNPISYTDQDGYEWEYRYNADNQRTHLFDPYALAYLYSHDETVYDDMGRVVGEINGRGYKTIYQRDSLGRVTASLDALGNQTNYELDVAGRITKVSDPMKRESSYRYNGFGETTAYTDPRALTTRYEVDALGRPTKQTDALSGVMQWSYNYRNQVTHTTDARDNTTQRHYNSFGNLTKVIDPLGGQTQYQWNAADKVTQVTNALGYSQSFDYDDLAQLKTHTNELNQQWNFVYNNMGRVETVRQPQPGTNINYNYDGRGNTITARYEHNGQGTTNAWQYDQVGRLARITNPTLDESYAFDGAGNLTTVTNHTMGQSYNYGFDAKNQRITSQVTASDSVQYQRDKAGQIERVLRIRNGKTVESFDLSYNDNGQLANVLYPNRSRRTLDYDALGRINGITIEAQQLKGNKWRNWEVVEQFEYEYDQVGNLTKQNRFGAKNRDQWASFEYDALNRLTHANYPKHNDIDYQWDAVGNLLEKSTQSYRYSYDYNRASQLTAFDGHRLPGFGCEFEGECNNDDEGTDRQRFDYQYDDNGHLVAVDSYQGTQTYLHDPLGRMTEVSSPNGSYVAYGYDSRSRRITTERNRLTDDGLQVPQTLVSQYDGRQEQAQFEAGKAFRSLTLLPEQNGYATVLHQALYNSDSPYLKASGDKGADINNLYLHQDRQGSTILALDSGNTQAMRLGYSPFGEVFRKHNDQTFWKPNSTVNANHQLGQLVPYQYTGKYTEGNTGLVQMDARWHNPHTHRFQQPDYWNFRNTGLPSEVQHELMAHLQLNTNQLLNDPSQQMSYGYVSGNPLKWVDPFGLNFGLLDYDMPQRNGMPTNYDVTSQEWSEASDKAATASVILTGLTFLQPQIVSITLPTIALLNSGSVIFTAASVASSNDVQTDLIAESTLEVGWKAAKSPIGAVLTFASPRASLFFDTLLGASKLKVGDSVKDTVKENYPVTEPTEVNQPELIMLPSEVNGRIGGGYTPC